MGLSEKMNILQIKAILQFFSLEHWNVISTLLSGTVVIVMNMVINIFAMNIVILLFVIYYYFCYYYYHYYYY